MAGRSVDRQIRLRSDDIAWREVEGQIVVLDLDGGVYLAVNETGVVLWHRIVGGATRDELAHALVEEYEVDPETALADAEAFVELLAEHGLVA